MLNLYYGRPETQLLSTRVCTFARNRKTIIMKYALILCHLALSWAAAAQQPEHPISWSFAAEQVSETDYELQLTATIKPGWYLYAQDLEEGGPIPTSVRFEEQDGLQLEGPVAEAGTAVEGMDELFGIHVKKFKHQAVFTQRATISKALTSVSGAVEFMSCDDEKCLPPFELPFTISLR